MTNRVSEADLVVTGLAAHVLGPNQSPNSSGYLRERKARKYLGVQDELALLAAGDALRDAGWLGRLPPERTGLYLSVGYIPFVDKDVAPVLQGSLDPNGDFSVERFAAEGYQRAHPLLAFRCLPNMPAYHVAANFGIEGPYYVGYPSAGELYLGLEQAILALQTQSIDVAIVLGVAHQRNFLVEHHMRRIDPPVAPERLRDAGAALVLERGERRAPLARLESLEIDYIPFDPLVRMPAREESIKSDAPLDTMLSDLEIGPSSPIVGLSRSLAAGASFVEHRVFARDGVRGKSRWSRA